MQNEKIKNIEFLRFIFAMMIIYAHVLWLIVSVFKMYPDIAFYKELYLQCTKSFLCVEYFFIISGFFLYKHIKEKQISTFEYAVNKLKRLYPLFLFSYFLIYLSALFIPIELHNYGNFMNIFMMSGTVTKMILNNNPYSWFISVLFFVSVFYHYLFRNYERKTVNLIIFLLTIISYTVLLNQFNGRIPGIQSHTIYIVQGSILRGAASFGLGCILYMLYEKIQKYLTNYKPKIFEYLLISFMEIYLFLFIINNSLFHRLNFKNNFLFIMVFSLLFLLFIINKGFLSKLLDNNISVYLGSFSYALYIMQGAGFNIDKYCIWGNKAFVYSHPYLNIFVSVILTAMIGIVSHCLIVKTVNIIKSYKNPPPPPIAAAANNNAITIFIYELMQIINRKKVLNISI